MATINSQPEFGFDHFRRYRDGEMSAQEQHSLEKRMLEEPLVADAYEGFLALNEDQIDYQSALESLRDTLNEQAKPEKSRTLPIWAYASAASIVLGMSLYWFVFIINKNTSTQDVAFEMSIEKPEHAAVDEEVKVKETPLPPASARPTPQKAYGNSPANTTTSEPVAAAAPAQEVQERLDTNLEESIAANDQEQISIVQTIPASATAAAALPSQAPLSESARKVTKNDAAGASATSLSSRPAPLNGWESFQFYLSKNALSAEQPGDVEVTFTVNADSTLSTFSTKGDRRFYQKAILTIQNGPAWIPARSDGQPTGMQTTVRIRFRNSN
ncbi:MAG: hypothetical protein ABIN80_16735 [Dyadobacter sp.]|uniref:energy transducer TonB family protein n=1 Tax=Dyadobacter sp. TaxID=1914288 RepID=UPI003263122B